MKRKFGIIVRILHSELWSPMHASFNTHFTTTRNASALIMFALILLVSTSAQAAWRASVPWKIGNSVFRYEGYGSTQEAARASAQQACSNAQTIPAYKEACEKDPAGNVAFTEVPEVGGSFGKSCEGCSISGNILKCKRCPPRYDVQLNMAPCSAAGLNSIENCKGHLYCGACPVIKGDGRLFPDKAYDCQRKDCQPL